MIFYIGLGYIFCYLTSYSFRWISCFRLQYNHSLAQLSAVYTLKYMIIRCSHKFNDKNRLEIVFEFTIVSFEVLEVISSLF